MARRKQRMRRAYLKGKPLNTGPAPGILSEYRSRVPSNEYALSEDYHRIFPREIVDRLPQFTARTDGFEIDIKTVIILRKTLNKKHYLVHTRDHQRWSILRVEWGCVYLSQIYPSRELAMTLYAGERITWTAI